MQTFLPLPSFNASAAVLDQARLGKQRVENLQIATALLTGRGWVHHPATKAWDGYEPALLSYHRAIVTEWTSRGFTDTTLGKMLALFTEHGEPLVGPEPWWLRNPAYHRAHRSNLLRKMPEHYSDYWPDLSPRYEYIWPDHANRSFRLSKPGSARVASGEFLDPR